MINEDKELVKQLDHFIKEACKEDELIFPVFDSSMQFNKNFNGVIQSHDPFIFYTSTPINDNLKDFIYDSCFSTIKEKPFLIEIQEIEEQESECLNTEKTKVQPSNLILKLLNRLNPPKKLGKVGFFDLSNYIKGNQNGST